MRQLTSRKNQRARFLHHIAVVVAGSAIPALLLSLPIAMWTWWFNIRHSDVVGALILTADVWLAFTLLLIPFAAAAEIVGSWVGRPNSFHIQTVLCSSILFFIIWFIRMEPAHQIISVKQHVSWSGVLDLLMLAVCSVILFRMGLSKKQGIFLFAISLALMSVGLELLARHQEPTRQRHDTIERVSRFVRLQAAAGPVVPPSRVMMIGIDGMDWRAVATLLQAGKLPTIEKLMRSGSYYEMDNLAMRVSAEIWTAIYTGVGAHANGVESFLRWNFAGISDPVIELPKFGFHSIAYVERILWYLRPLHLWSARPVSNRDFAAPPIWTILTKERKQVAVIDPMPMSSVPENVSGPFIVFRDGRAVTFEDHTRRELPLGAVRSDLSAARFLQDEHDRSPIISGILRGGKYDVAIYYTHFLDSIQHFAWDFAVPGCFFCRVPSNAIESSAFLSSIVADGYIEADRTIKSLIDAFGQPATVVLISDHGWEFNDYKHFLSPVGVLVISPSQRGGNGGVVSVLQIAPTILSLARVPTGTEMKSPIAVGQPIPASRDYSSLLAREFFGVNIRDQETLKGLRSLGYVGQ
jgi:hypothetical protein